MYVVIYKIDIYCTCFEGENEQHKCLNQSLHMMTHIIFPIILQNGTDKERLEQLLSEINKHIKPPEETVEPDPGWLAGTAADIHKKVHVRLFVRFDTHCKCLNSVNLHL